MRSRILYSRIILFSIIVLAYFGNEGSPASIENQGTADDGDRVKRQVVRRVNIYNDERKLVPLFCLYNFPCIDHADCSPGHKRNNTGRTGVGKLVKCSCNEPTARCGLELVTN